MNKRDTFQISTEEHPFAAFVRILGKGKTGSRSLSEAEAASAFGMIMRGEVEPLQLGAFLMLLRVKEETGEELAGFVQACRAGMQPAPATLKADIDWSSYAGKKHQHPWFLLAILLLNQAGQRVFIHGSDGHTPGRLYTEQAMLQLGLPVAADWCDAQQKLDEQGLCYLPLRCFCEPLHEMMQLRPLLGLRSPVNTLARMLNPLAATYSVQSVFHPAYAELHQAADQLLGQPHALVFKGESGEVEIKPQADTRLRFLSGSSRREITLPRSITERATPVAAPSVEPLRALWRGQCEDTHGEQAVLATTACILMLCQQLERDDALREAGKLWQERDTGRLD